MQARRASGVEEMHAASYDARIRLRRLVTAHCQKKSWRAGGNKKFGRVRSAARDARGTARTSVDWPEEDWFEPKDMM